VVVDKGRPLAIAAQLCGVPLTVPLFRTLGAGNNYAYAAAIAYAHTIDSLVAGQVALAHSAFHSLAGNTSRQFYPVKYR
jgi:hypothetical protein